jgi:hypothetical protein
MGSHIRGALEATGDTEATEARRHGMERELIDGRRHMAGRRVTDSDFEVGQWAHGDGSLCVRLTGTPAFSRVSRDATVASRWSVHCAGRPCGWERTEDRAVALAKHAAAKAAGCSYIGGDAA